MIDKGSTEAGWTPSLLLASFSAKAAETAGQAAPIMPEQTTPPSTAPPARDRAYGLGYLSQNGTQNTARRPV